MFSKYHIDELKDININTKNVVYYNRLSLTVISCPPPVNILQSSKRVIEFEGGERTDEILIHLLGTKYSANTIKVFLKAFNLFYQHNSFQCIRLIDETINSSICKNIDTDGFPIPGDELIVLFNHILEGITEYNIIVYGTEFLLHKIIILINVALNIDSYINGFLKNIVEDIRTHNVEYHSYLNFEINRMDLIDPVKIRNEEFIYKPNNSFTLGKQVHWKILDPKFKSNIDLMIKTITKSKYTDFLRNVNLFVESMNKFAESRKSEVAVHLNTFIILFRYFKNFDRYKFMENFEEGSSRLIYGIDKLLENDFKLNTDKFYFDDAFFVYLNLAWNLNRFNPGFLVKYIDIDDSNYEKVNEADNKAMMEFLSSDSIKYQTLLAITADFFEKEADKIADNIENVAKELEKEDKESNTYKLSDEEKINVMNQIEKLQRDTLKAIEEAEKKKDGPDQNNISWDQYYMAIATLVRERSKDPVTKVGACIVKDNKVISTGYNGFPVGISDYTYPWSKNSDKPTENKYFYVVHAELNAILSAKQSLDGCTLYVTKFPCNECAKAIIQSGIKKIIYREPSAKFYKGKIDKEIVLTLFKEAGIECVFYQEEGREIKIAI